MSQKDFFSKLPTIQYPYRGKLVDGNENNSVDYIECTDLTIRFQLASKILTNRLSAYPYRWKDEDRPDTIAFLYYGHEKYHWVVLLSGSVFDWIHELPMPDNELRQFMENKYGSTPLNSIHHYEVNGYIVDQQTYLTAQGLGEPCRSVTIYEYEQERNEKRREIKLINKDLLPLVVREYEDKVRKIKNQRKKNPIEVSL